MKLEAAKHVEAVGAMKLEDKELTGGCNGESEEAVDVKLLNLCEIAESVGSRCPQCRRAACWVVDVGVVAAGDASKRESEEIRWSPMEDEWKGRSAVEKNGMRAKDEVKKLGRNP
ncbi:hypothetical protein LXL04_023054 [Taraxacum kok-saghyz]